MPVEASFVAVEALPLKLATLFVSIVIMPLPAVSVPCGPAYNPLLPVVLALEYRYKLPAPLLTPTFRSAVVLPAVPAQIDPFGVETELAVIDPLNVVSPLL